jgi:hypothetical protein
MHKVDESVLLHMQLLYQKEVTRSRSIFQNLFFQLIFTLNPQL